jgi:hypothetical protein
VPIFLSLESSLELLAAHCTKNPQSYPVLPLMPSTHRADLLQRARQASFALFLQALAVFLKLESLVEFVA